MASFSSSVGLSSNAHLCSPQRHPEVLGSSQLTPSGTHSHSRSTIASLGPRTPRAIRETLKACCPTPLPSSPAVTSVISSTTPGSDQNGSKRTARHIEVARVSGKRRLDDHFVSRVEWGACREIAPQANGHFFLKTFSKTSRLLDALPLFPEK